MEKQQGAVTFKGKPLALVGKKVAVGGPAPDFNCARAATRLRRSRIMMSCLSRAMDQLVGHSGSTS